MFSQHLMAAVALALLGTASAQCEGETSALNCYNPPDGNPENVSTSDIAYVAKYLRAYGAQTRAGRMFAMTVADTPNCDEFTLYQHGTVLALAKHINNQVNSSVLYSDIANTIDGGANATPDQQAAAIIGCGTSGGAEGVQYNASNPAYTSTTYPAGYTPDGILIKIVNSAAS